MPLASYATKQNRKKLLAAYSARAELAAILPMEAEEELAIRTSAGRLLLVGSAQISEKATRYSRTACTGDRKSGTAEHHVLGSRVL